MFVIYTLIVIAALFFITLYILYDMIFKKKNRGGLSLVKKSLRYDKFKDAIKSNIEKIKAAPYEEFTITSYDGYELSAKYYHVADNAPAILFFHGYRSYAEFDGNFLFHIFRERGCNILMVNQRAHGDSKARALTFGIKESDDCARWVEFMAKKFGRDLKIILCGMSMGASTVLMASDKSLDADVCGIIADCGFYSPREALRHVIGTRGYPVGITYFFVKLAAVIFAGFNPDSKTTGDALAHSDIPVLVIHGDKDGFVPYEMGVKNYEAIRSKKKLVTVHGAGHAVSGGVNPTLYGDEINKFLDEIL